MPSLITAAQEVIDDNLISLSDFLSPPDFSRNGRKPATPASGTVHASKLVRDAVRAKLATLPGITEAALLEEIYRTLLTRYSEYAIPLTVYRVR